MESDHWIYNFRSVLPTIIDAPLKVRIYKSFTINLEREFPGNPNSQDVPELRAPPQPEIYPSTSLLSTSEVPYTIKGSQDPAC